MASAAQKLRGLVLLVAAICVCSRASAAALKTRGTVVKRVSARPAQRGQGFWSVRGKDFIDSAGNVVSFSGVTWIGFEGPDAVVHGLDRRTYSSHLDQMKKLGFNMIRLAFAGETLLPSTRPQPWSIAANPDLQGLNSLQVMDKIISACGARGIKVILDYHRMRLTNENEWGLWYDADHPESLWISNWAMLAKRYKGNPTVIGADLFNEVHPNKAFPPGAPYWVNYNAGALEKYNFRSATLRVMKAIHAVEPNWIIFMEGMHNNYWWGGNCMILNKAAIREPRNKIAYSTHEYGPYVGGQKWFSVKDFPGNLIPLYQRRWGNLIERGIVPVWIGEFGSFYPRPSTMRNKAERIVFTTLIAYIKKLNASWTIFSWGPESADTGGILTEDWLTPNYEKLNLLKGIMHPGFGPSP